MSYCTPVFPLFEVVSFYSGRFLCRDRKWRQIHRTGRVSLY